MGYLYSGARNCDNDGLLTDFFVLQHNTILTDQAKRVSVRSCFVKGKSLGNQENTHCCHFIIE